MRRAISLPRGLISLAALALASCDSESSSQVLEDSSGTAATAPKRLAGSWVRTNTVTRYEVSGPIPAWAREAGIGKASVGQKTVENPRCLSRQRAAADTLDARLRDVATRHRWTEERREFSHGRVSFAASRRDLVGFEIRVVVTGALSADRSLLTVVTTSRPVVGTGRFEIESVIENRRLGDCSPGQLFSI